MSQQDPESLDRWLATAIREARNGDKELAEKLIDDFAALATAEGEAALFGEHGGAPKELIRYIAACLADWKRRGYKDAALYFNVERPVGRPTRQLTVKHAIALAEYRSQIARGLTTESARSFAATASGLRDDQVRALVDDQRNPDKRDEFLEWYATELIDPEIRALIEARIQQKKI